jgi:hypothetical protein
MKNYLALGALLSLSLASTSVAMDKQSNDEVGVHTIVNEFEDRVEPS